MSITGKSVTVTAERFGGNGRKIENVTVNVSVQVGAVYLYIKGSGPPKHYVMPVASWLELVAAKDTGKEEEQP